MKREKTEFEKKLIEMGYRLSEKTYTGKNSDRIQYYIYSKEIPFNGKNCLVKVLLDFKREKYKDIIFENTLDKFFSEDCLKDFEYFVSSIKMWVELNWQSFEIDDELGVAPKLDDVDDDEIVQVAEEIKDYE